MKKILEKHILSSKSILIICIIIASSCNGFKKLSQKGSDWQQSAYIDSVIIKMPRVQIVSEELKMMLDTLIHEVSRYEPIKGFPDYPALISVSADRKTNKLITLSIGKSYIFSYHFHGAEDNSPFYPDVHPLIPSKLGLSLYKGYQIDYLWTMKYFIHDNVLGNPEIIKVEQDSIELTAYAPRLKETGEWVYQLMPSVTLYCEAVGDRLVFQKFEYDDGRIKYVK